jgi:hypothetical protein
MDARLHYRRRSRRLRVRVFFARIARVPHRSEVTRSRRSVSRSLTRLSRACKRSSHSARSSAPSPAGEVNSALALRLRALFLCSVVDEQKVEIRRALTGRISCSSVDRVGQFTDVRDELIATFFSSEHSTDQIFLRVEIRRPPPPHSVARTLLGSSRHGGHRDGAARERR